MISIRSLLPALGLLSLLAIGCSDSPGDPVPVIRGSEVERGSVAPDFRLLDPADNQVALSDFRGKVVLLEFWASWCTYCLAAMPKMVDIWEDYGPEDFVILGVSLDHREIDWLNYLEAHPDVSWPQVYEPLGSVVSPTNDYGVRGTPTSFVIDREGIVHSIHVGNVSEETLRNEIELLLAE